MAYSIRFINSDSFCSYGKSYKTLAGATRACAKANAALAQWPDRDGHFDQCEVYVERDVMAAAMLVSTEDGFHIYEIG